VTYLHTLDDETLLRHAHAELDELTSSPLEIELMKRFEATLNEQDAIRPLLDYLDDADHQVDTDELQDHLSLLNDFSTLNIRALMEAITDAGIDDVESLKARLSRADEFDAIANDAGDLFARLNTLATKE